MSVSKQPVENLSEARRKCSRGIDDGSGSELGGSARQHFVRREKSASDSFNMAESRQAHMESA